MADTIRTARLLLRPARAHDLDDLHAVLSDPRAMRYWSTPPHATRDETAAFLAGLIAAEDDYAIAFEDRCIGKAGCWRLPEIGVILHPDAWGRGFAREALAAVIPAIFARRDIPAITADVDPRNAASLRLLTSLHFVATGRAARTFEIAGEWVDSVYLARPRA